MTKVDTKLELLWFWVSLPFRSWIARVVTMLMVFFAVGMPWFLKTMTPERLNLLTSPLAIACWVLWTTWLVYPIATYVIYQHKLR